MDFTLKDTRLDEWGIRKKQIHKKIAPNHKSDGSVKFRIQPYSIWWFDIGENIGTIDTKRLYKLIYPELKIEDINNIKDFVKKYFGI